MQINNKRVLVTDGDCRSALAVTRSLGGKGIYVIVGDENKFNISSVSKYCSKSYRYISPYLNPNKFAENIYNIVQSEDVNLIIPITDVSMDIILSFSDKFESKLLRAIPNYDSYLKMTDKINMLKLASNLNICIPKSIFINNIMDSVMLNEVEYPLIVKPSKSKLNCNGKYVSTSVSYVKSREEFILLCKEKEYLKYPFIVQSIIKGETVGLFALYSNGIPITHFCHRRLRERPPSGGVSVLCESIPVNEQLKNIADKLLTTVDWNGVAMLEFIIEDKTNIPYLIEVNGRFWGSLQLAIDSGVDFPYMLFLMASENKINREMSYIVGRKSRWLLGDIDYIYLRMFKDSGNQGLENGLIARFKDTCRVLKYNGNKCSNDVLRSNDLYPFFIELYKYLFK